MSDDADCLQSTLAAWEKVRLSERHAILDQQGLQIADNREALTSLAALLNGRAGAKAEGNAAGALLALGVCDHSRGWQDPVSVLSEVQSA